MSNCDKQPESRLVNYFQKMSAKHIRVPVWWLISRLAPLWFFFLKKAANTGVTAGGCCTAATQCSWRVTLDAFLTQWGQKPLHCWGLGGELGSRACRSLSGDKLSLLPNIWDKSNLFFYILVLGPCDCCKWLSFHAPNRSRKRKRSFQTSVFFFFESIKMFLTFTSVAYYLVMAMFVFVTL